MNNQEANIENNSKSNSLKNKISSSPIKLNKTKLLTLLGIIVIFLIKNFIPSSCDNTGTMCYNKYHFFITISNYLLIILVGYLIIEIFKDIISNSKSSPKNNV